jgi:hypothetical protein
VDSIDDMNCDPPPSKEDAEWISALTDAQRTRIDVTLLRNASTQWQKMARIVAMTMSDVASDMDDVPYIYCADRLRHFVALGQLEFQGDLRIMRFCELRIAQASERGT